MPFFKNVFNSRDKQKSKTAPEPAAPPKPRWEESWTRKEVAPEEIQELVHVCTQEMKSRGKSTLRIGSCPVPTDPHSSSGYALHATALSPHLRYKRLAQLHPQLLQGRLRRNRPVFGRAAGTRIASDRALGTLPLHLPSPPPRQCSVLTDTDALQYYQMVLEQAARRRSHL